MVPLRIAREAKGLSQKALERETGIQQATLSRAELGKGVTPEQAATLVRFFGFPWEERHFLYPERYVDMEFVPPPPLTPKVQPDDSKTS